MIDPADLMERFAKRYAPVPPAVMVRAPGRINLIGEHTDYNGFPVLPMAIDRSIAITAAPRDDGRIVLCNAVRDEYSDREFEIARHIPPFPAGDWGNYAKAAVQSLVQLAFEQGRDLASLRGMSCCVHGDVPPASGLSSSTALVVATALAFCRCNDFDLDRVALADRMAQAEYYVGTRGGGMDQAACLLAAEEHAVKVDFFPLRVRRCRFPGDCRIVAAHSTVWARKTAERREAYNRRVLACRVGARLLAERLGVPKPERLADVVAQPAGPDVDSLIRSLPELLQGSETVTLADAARVLELEPSDLNARFPGVFDSDRDGPTAEALPVLKRCRHVFSEAARTDLAAELLTEGDIQRVGCLMDASHESCASDYGISCPELDSLTRIMRSAGALGARLTGAGFGGFAVGLVPAGQVLVVLDALQREFYAPRHLEPDGHVYVFRPAPGASVRELC